MKAKIVVVLGLLLLGGLPLFAAVDAFMKIDGISGESKTVRQVLPRSALQMMPASRVPTRMRPF